MKKLVYEIYDTQLMLNGIHLNIATGWLIF